MAGHRLTADAPDDVVAGYLADLAARLRGPRRRREAILAELSDGLDQAVHDHRAAGLPAGPAAEAAVVQFGAPQAVADAFGGELTTAYARRTITWFIATGPLVGSWWLLLLHPTPWRTGPAPLFAAIPVLPLIAIAIATAAATVATTGRLMRWLPETSPHHALTATIAVAALSLAGDLTMIIIFAASGTPLRPLSTMALAASLTRVACGITTIRHTTRLRGR
ncbi:permease prefix domain 1-containing protein [Actinoplanes sp. NPDC049668]|uniref:permease prefix domain 1-containing protein n=1 Tax=unclassified Actinoplanes TaxID=2626549 RepID=UPI0033B24D80